MTSAEKLITTAIKEIGYLEKTSNYKLDDYTINAGHNNWTKYARDLDNMGVYNFPKNGYAWCDVFVDWCFVKTFGLEIAMKMTGQQMGGYGAGCSESANYFKNIGRFFKSEPHPGDQIFFTSDWGKSFYHTGIVEKVSGGMVYTIEGNTSSASGVVPNGGMVWNKSYSLSYTKIGGYGRPDYSLIREDDEDVDVNRFKELWDEMRIGLQDNDSGTWSEKARQWAIETGLIVGGGDNNGQPNYMWADMLTREQAITLFYRFAQMMGKA